MAARKKADSTLLKEARARIEELEENAKHREGTVKMYREKAEKAEAEIAAVHTALDTVGVPRHVKSDTAYCGKVDMSITSRLFAWQMGARVTSVEE